MWAHTIGLLDILCSLLTLSLTFQVAETVASIVSVEEQEEAVKEELAKTTTTGTPLSTSIL